MIAQATARRLISVDDLDRMPDDGTLRELVAGELREWMAPGPEHAAIEIGLGSALHQFVTRSRLGHVLCGEVRFLITGNVCHARLADVAFVAAGKYPNERPPKMADATQPDFVAEIISPDDTATMVQEKVQDWLSTGVRLLWLVYPDTRQVVAYRPDRSAQTVDHGDVLDGGDVYPLIVGIAGCSAGEPDRPRRSVVVTALERWRGSRYVARRCAARRGGLPDRTRR